MLAGGYMMSSEFHAPVDIEGKLDFTLPGKLGNPDLMLPMDPRLDPRIAHRLMEMAALYPAQMPNVTMDMDYEEAVEFIGFMHAMMTVHDKELFANMPAFEGIVSREHLIGGAEGYSIELFIDQPRNSHGSLPGVVHLHGGGMTFDTARSASNVRWRKALAEHELVVIGVEFRNEALSLGHQPFPAGLNDCVTAVRWAHDNRDELGISSIVVIGESGGANLAIATGIQANVEGWVNAIQGVYAMAPMIFGFYDSPPPELMSWRENLGLVGTHGAVRAMRMVYDPDAVHKDNPLAYPFSATTDVLKGLPPHILHNYELDLIRDEGVVFAQKLRAAGVAATSKIINGAHHVPEIIMPDTVPELTADTLASIASFARGCTP
jgi:acetyl esterase/lipase